MTAFVTKPNQIEFIRCPQCKNVQLAIYPNSSYTVEVYQRGITCKKCKTLADAGTFLKKKKLLGFDLSKGKNIYKKQKNRKRYRTLKK